MNDGQSDSLLHAEDVFEEHRGDKHQVQGYCGHRTSLPSDPTVREGKGKGLKELKIALASAETILGCAYVPVLLREVPTGMRSE